MKTSIILFLIFISFSYQEPADERRANSPDYCGNEDSQNSLSDCVDSKLPYRMNRCCFLRYQEDGVEYKNCTALTEEQYLDIVETKRQIEDNHFNTYYKGKTEGKRIKVYQLECSGSSIKFLTFASILLALLF